MTTGRKVVVAGAAVGTGWMVVRTGAFYALAKLAAFVAAQQALAEARDVGALRLGDDVIDLREEIATA